MLEVTRPTAYAAIDALVERGDLIEVTGQQRNRVFEAPRIIDAVYRDVYIDEAEGRTDDQLDFELSD